MAGRTWSIEELQTYVFRRWPDCGKVAAHRPDHGTAMAVSAINELIGWPGPTGRQRYHRARRRGYLTDVQAEKIGDELCGDPSRIWPGWYDILDESVAS